MTGPGGGGGGGTPPFVDFENAFFGGVTDSPHGVLIVRAITEQLLHYHLA